MNEENNNEIPSPFPYLNPDSDVWKGVDEDDDSDGQDFSGGLLPA